MRGLPTSDWGDAPDHVAGFDIKKIETETVRHVFTHFELTLSIARAHVKTLPDGYEWADPANAGLPSVFEKVVRLMQ